MECPFTQSTETYLISEVVWAADLRRLYSQLDFNSRGLEVGPGHNQTWRKQEVIRKPTTYFFGLVRARTSRYELKSRRVDEEPRIQKKVDSQFHFQEE